jgi:hypothetical protein
MSTVEFKYQRIHVSRGNSMGQACENVTAEPRDRQLRGRGGSVARAPRGTQLLLMFPVYVLRFTELIVLVRLLGRRYRSDMAGDGPTT